MSVVLVVNSGSSSFKYQLLDADAERVLAAGLVERIGADVGQARHTVYAARTDGPAATMRSATSTRELPIPDHTAGFQVMLDAYAADGPSLAENPPIAVGHRVVHGGARFFAPTLVTAQVRADIEDLAVLAPLARLSQRVDGGSRPAVIARGCLPPPDQREVIRRHRHYLLQR